MLLSNGGIGVINIKVGCDEFGGVQSFANSGPFV